MNEDLKTDMIEAQDVDNSCSHIGCNAEALTVIFDVPSQELTQYCPAHLAEALAAAEPEMTVVASPDGLRLSVLLEYKMGLPDYSSATASMHVASITVDTTDAELDALIERGHVAWSLIGPKITAQVRAARAKAGWETNG